MRRAILVAAAFSLAACAQTGDPRQGGLFGWSESMARERVAERRTAVAAADAELAREQSQSRDVQARNSALTRDERAAARQRDQAVSALAERETRVTSKASQLLAQSPTPASASRARRLRREVDAVRANRALSATERARELRRLELDLDAALQAGAR